MYNKNGFTLIELLVVISIVAILASVVFFALSQFREKAKGAKYIVNINSIQRALEMYYLDYGTYVIPGTGYNGEGHGYLSYSDGQTYPKSPAQQLVDEGYLSQNTHDAILLDGYNTNVNYLIYHCNNGTEYSLSVTLPDGSPYINTPNLALMCAGSWVISNGKNYGVSNI